LSKFFDEAKQQLPYLVKERRLFLRGWLGADRLPGRQRLAVQLRLARLLGCPVCVAAFSRWALRQGLGGAFVQSALEGQPEGLPEGVHPAVAWAEAVLKADGDPAGDLPEAARTLPETQREHLRYMMRLELLVHATGLFFLPHSIILRAAGQ
jgi:alkylhydroperoxidase family enzyme